MDDSHHLGPFVANGLVFISGRYGPFYALNARTGEKKWEFSRRIYSVKPATEEELVYAAGPRGLFALEQHSGSVRWEIPKLTVAPYSSFTITSELIYLTDGKVLYALSTKTGETQWNVSFEAVHDSIIFHNDQIYGLVKRHSRTTLCAFEAVTGFLMWEIDVNDRRASPRATNEGVYIMDTHGNYSLVHAETGRVLQTTAWKDSVFKGISFSVASKEALGTLFATELLTNTRKWENARYGHCSVITVQHGLVYVYDKSPYGPWYEIVALSEATGEYQWSQSSFLTWGTEFVLIDRIGYAGTDRGLKSFNAITGETNWQYEPPFPKNVYDTDKYSDFNPFGKKIAVSNGVVYVTGTKQIKLYALDEMNGVECWKFSL